MDNNKKIYRKNQFRLPEQYHHHYDDKFTPVGEPLFTAGNNTFSHKFQPITIYQRKDGTSYTDQKKPLQEFPLIVRHVDFKHSKDFSFHCLNLSCYVNDKSIFFLD